jgi:hypothetical protein
LERREGGMGREGSERMEIIMMGLKSEKESPKSAT